jgi:hypothetical protein
MQFLRVAAGGNTLEPTQETSRSLISLGLSGSDEYETLATGEGLALHLEVPAPIVGGMLEDLDREGIKDFPEPPEPATVEAGAEDDAEGESGEG